ncbi:unnamed protein product [Vitrella brassicaformis CCMP3155]|uniref:Uncharacterized protein n=1 Tax=Vitrella brassicaformis (strain CCMP3155) TaxID=1169540 RepID=A0A0G4FTK3_VITBC|nr:unnamed protein product [Vitrella brassicaformis CCMP3155]|eukprot:CEM18266.1 unnamed protein product [Vitrella brassicaformis CCMP3155]
MRVAIHRVIGRLSLKCGDQPGGRDWTPRPPPIQNRLQGRIKSSKGGETYESQSPRRLLASHVDGLFLAHPGDQTQTSTPYVAGRDIISCYRLSS